MNPSYNQALIEMLQDCLGWDSESKALIEAFNKGIDFQKKVMSNE